MLRTPVTSIAACAQPHWLVKPGGLKRSPKRCGIVTLRIDSTVGISEATGALTAPRFVRFAALYLFKSLAPNVNSGRIAGATSPAAAIFRKSLRFCSLILLVTFTTIHPNVVKRKQSLHNNTTSSLVDSSA